MAFEFIIERKLKALHTDWKDIGKADNPAYNYAFREFTTTNGIQRVRISANGASVVNQNNEVATGFHHFLYFDGTNIKTTLNRPTTQSFSSGQLDEIKEAINVILKVNGLK